MKIDETDFNVEVIKRLTEDKFIETHFNLRSDLEPESREKWLRMVYSQVTGKKLKTTKEVKTKNEGSLD